MPTDWFWPRGLEFHHPWLFLLAIPGVLIVIWNYRRRGSAPTLVFPSLAPFRGMPSTLRRRARFLIPLFQSTAIVLLVGAVARPRMGEAHTVIRSEGIAIQMVLDRSGSMQRGMRFEGRSRSRMEIVKRVFQDFVSGDEDRGGNLPGRKTDLIGLTTFARFTEESCPLVSEHEPLLTAVANLTTVPEWLDQYDRPLKNPPRTNAEARAALQRGCRQNPFNRTAIGDGLFRAVTSLVTAEADIGLTEDNVETGEDDSKDLEDAGKDLEDGLDTGSYKIKGKVIILLTDGENNAGEYDPVEAGKYATENDIRVYYILLRERVDRGIHPFTGQEVVVREYSADELLDVPRRVAGDPARAFLASDGDALRRIYEEIDRLERSEIGRTEYRSYRERFHLLLIPGAALLAVALLLGETWLRRMP